MGIASGLFWIVIGVAYVIYQGFKADWANTVIVLLVGIAIPVAGVVIYLIDKLLQLIHPLFAGAVWCTAIAVGLVLFLVWCARDSKKKEVEREESRRRREEEFRKYENRDFSEDEVNKMISKFLDKGGQDDLRIMLHRIPTDEEIREAAVESATKEFFMVYKAVDKCLRSI